MSPGPDDGCFARDPLLGLYVGCNCTHRPATSCCCCIGTFGCMVPFGSVGRRQDRAGHIKPTPQPATSPLSGMYSCGSSCSPIKQGSYLCYILFRHAHHHLFPFLVAEPTTVRAQRCGSSSSSAPFCYEDLYEDETSRKRMHAPNSSALHRSISLVQVSMSGPASSRSEEFPQKSAEPCRWASAGARSIHLYFLEGGICVLSMQSVLSPCNVCSCGIRLQDVTDSEGGHNMLVVESIREPPSVV